MTTTVSSSGNISSIIGNGTRILTPHFPIAIDMIFFIGAGSLGTLFNSLVLIIALKYVNSDDKPRQILVFNMTIADLLFNIYVLSRPITLQFSAPDFLSPYLCQLYFMFIWLNVDKFIAIQDPLHYTSFVDRKRVLKISLLSWVSICVLAFALSSSLESTAKCRHLRATGEAYIPICVLFGLMILASFIISTIIYIVVEKSSRADQRHRSIVYERLLFIFSSTLWTFFTCFPYHVIFSVGKLCEGCKTPFLGIARHISHRISIIGTVINPLITIWTQRTYRLGLMRLLGKKKPAIATAQATNKRWHGAPFNDERGAESTAL